MVHQRHWITFWFMVSMCTHVSHLAKLSIGLVIQPSPMCELCQIEAETLVEEWKTSNSMEISPNIDISIYATSDKEPLTLNNHIKNVICKPTVALLSVEPCSASLALALRDQQVPLIPINSDVTCYLHPGPRTIPLPGWINLEDILRHVMSKLPWETVNIFYDSTADQKIKGVLLDIFEEQFVTVEQFSIQTGSLSSSIHGYLHQSQRYEMEHTTNNVILCGETCVTEILKQANLLNNQLGHLHGFLLTSRWLVITSRTENSYIQHHLGNIDNLAVLSVGSMNDATLEHRVQMGLSLLDSSVRTWSATWSGSFLDADGCPSAPAMAELTKEILGHAENMSLPLISCSGYELHSVMWLKENHSVTKSLVPQPLCVTEDKTPVLNPHLQVLPNSESGFNLRLLTVGTNLLAPYMSMNEVNGSVEYYGLCMDVLNELAMMLNFTYKLVKTGDNQWGVDLGNGTWTGLVGLLQNQEVDLVIAPLTITAERQEVMDFTSAFFTEESGILIRLPDQNALKWRVVIEPFRWPVWSCIFLSVPIMGLVACYVTRLTSLSLNGSSGWMADIFEDLERATWYVFGALLTQGGAYEPQTSPGRAVIALWWCYSIVLVAAYGGNLIAFLTVSKVEVPFDSLEGMLDQSAYTWGTMGGTVYISALESSTYGPLHEIWQKIKQFAADDPEVLSSDFNAHIAKVKAGQYGFISSRTALLGAQTEECDFNIIKERFLPSVYGLGLQKGSQYKRPFSTVLESLRSSGMVDYWQQRHWPQERGCQSLVLTVAKPVSILDTQSAFYVLSGGILLALVIFLVEKIRHHTKQQTKVVALTPKPQLDS